MKLPASISLRPEVMAREVGDEVVLLDLVSGNYYGLDRVGARVWQLLGEGLGPAQVCDQMEGEFEVSREHLERDVGDLLAALAAQNLIGLG